jgi:uncharacterized protein (TIGR03067 family)
VNRLGILALGFLSAGLSAAPDALAPAGGGQSPVPALIRSVKGGPWSAADTWEGGKVPAAGARVQVRAGHAVTYDVKSDETIRSIHVAGTLTFTRDRDTILTVGLIKIQPGDDASEDGFNCDAHVRPPDPDKPPPTLEVGTPNDPISAGRTAVIRLAMVEGLDKESCPAIVCCGGRLDLHGAPLARTWVKLGASADKGDAGVRLTEPAAGWRVGDRVIVTSTGRSRITDRGTLRLEGPDDAVPGGRIPGRRPTAQTEERVVNAIDGDRLTLDKPLAFRHSGEGDYRGEVANLSRNVVVESADPKGVRGHTMYHRHSAGSISYAEFRHLGKEGLLGKYPIHFHLCGDTMRGSSVIGASVWDSHNRWVTVHGTQYLVIRDCVGYQSVGHGFYLEDGTEVFNVFDRNLAVHAFFGKPQPGQVLPFDRNDGAGFWWANNQNTFTRNVAAECDRWGFLFEATPTKDFDLRRPVPQPDGTTEPVDLRTLSFVRFEDNEAHDQLDGVSLGGFLGVGAMLPGAGDPLVLRNTRIWHTQWAFTANTRYAVDNLDIADCVYGFMMSPFDIHVPPGYREGTKGEPDWGRITIHRTLFPLRLPESVPSYYGGPFDVMEFAGDCLPPTTVITHVRQVAGKLVVRGTAADNGEIRKVTVNGQAAKALTGNFAEWEVALDAPADGKLTARAVDRAGNEEPRQHTVVLSGSGLRTIVPAVAEVPKSEGLPDATRLGSEGKGLAGRWRVEYQRRAGRPTERPRGMTWEFDGGAISVAVAGQTNDARNRGANRIPYQLDPAGGTGHIELRFKVSVHPGIYRLEGDTLTICAGASRASAAYDPMGKASAAKEEGKTRPTEFSPEAGTVLVLRRVRD